MAFHARQQRIAPRLNADQVPSRNRTRNGNQPVVVVAQALPAGEASRKTRPLNCRCRDVKRTPCCFRVRTRPGALTVECVATASDETQQSSRTV
jgi:hypothetical protein